MRWTTKLTDGTMIGVQREMKRRRALWYYQIIGRTWSSPSTKFFDSATQAQDAALAAWRSLK
jgi:hypothetical protein